MGPVKDSDLLKSVRDNNRTKLLKYLSPEKGLGSLSKVGVKDDQSFPGGRLRLKLNHVNINCREEKTGYTPLILAVLNGSKEFVDDILFHSADVDVQDIKGNTALHMAVFGGKMEIIDLLLQNRAEVNVQNSDGNTPLHIASQIEGDRVHMLLKLLTKGADHTIMNRDHKEALDLAIMFKRTDAVSILLDHDHGLEDSKRTTTEPNTQAMLEASIRGYKEGMELLLDYGYDPNTLDKEMDSTALQEAVRYNRLQVIETLLKYGAKTDVKNSKNETAETVLAGLPDSRANPIKALFEEYKKSGATQVPRFLKTLSRGMSLQGVKDCHQPATIPSCQMTPAGHKTAPITATAVHRMDPTPISLMMTPVAVGWPQIFIRPGVSLTYVMIIHSQESLFMDGTALRWFAHSNFKKGRPLMVHGLQLFLVRV